MNTENKSAPGQLALCVRSNEVNYAEQVSEDANENMRADLLRARRERPRGCAADARNDLLALLDELHPLAVRFEVFGRRLPEHLELGRHITDSRFSARCRLPGLVACC